MTNTENINKLNQIITRLNSNKALGKLEIVEIGQVLKSTIDNLSGNLSVTGVDNSGDYKVNGTKVVGSQEPLIVGLTNSTTGSATDTIGDVGAAFNQVALNNIHASLTAKINAVLTLIKNHGLGAS